MEELTSMLIKGDYTEIPRCVHAVLWSGLHTDMPDILESFDNVRYVRELDEKIIGKNPIYVFDYNYEVFVKILPDQYVVYEYDGEIEAVDKEVFEQLFEQA